MAKKQALGRGLSALLENAGNLVKEKNEKATVVESPAVEISIESPIGHIAGDISLVPVSLIEANPFQPRQDFTPDALIELAQSIKELGLIQPITVRRISAKKYQIISGERRFRASQMAGLEEVPVYGGEHPARKSECHRGSHQLQTIDGRVQHEYRSTRRTRGERQNYCYQLCPLAQAATRNSNGHH